MTLKHTNAGLISKRDFKEGLSLHHLWQLSVQCVDDPIPLNAVVDYGDEAFPMHNHHPVRAWLLSLSSSILEKCQQSKLRWDVQWNLGLRS